MGLDWHAEFYRLDRILSRFAGNLLAFRWIQTLLGLKLGLTYRYDNRREKITGHNPARWRPCKEGTSPAYLGRPAGANWHGRV